MDFGLHYEACCCGSIRVEVLIDAGLMPEHRLSTLMQEGDEILAMTVASIKTLRKRKWPLDRLDQSKI